MDNQNNNEYDSDERNRKYVKQVYAKRECYERIWNTEYNRSQCLKLLNMTGHQFDYAVKQFDIKLKKIGHAAIFTARQLFDIKLAIYLKELDYPIEVIKEFFFIRDESFKKNKIFLDYAFPIPGMEEYEVFSIFSFSDESGLNGKVFREIENNCETVGKGETCCQVRKDIYKYYYENDKGNTWFLFLNEQEMKSIGLQLINKIKKQVGTLAIEPILQEINDELQASSKKHNISLPNVA